MAVQPGSEPCVHHLARHRCLPWPEAGPLGSPYLLFSCFTVWPVVYTALIDHSGAAEQLVAGGVETDGDADGDWTATSTAVG